MASDFPHMLGRGQPRLPRPSVTRRLRRHPLRALWRTRCVSPVHSRTRERQMPGYAPSTSSAGDVRSYLRYHGVQERRMASGEWNSAFRI
jgi:hypothetical protein